MPKETKIKISPGAMARIKRQERRKKRKREKENRRYKREKKKHSGLNK
jgi:hypothetical protein